METGMTPTPRRFSGKHLSHVFFPKEKIVVQYVQ